MKRLILALVLLAGTLLAAPSGAAVAAEPGPGSVTGVVYDALGNPLAGVEYTTGFAGAVTGADGRYQIDDLWPGWEHYVSFVDSSGLRAPAATGGFFTSDTEAVVIDVTMPDAVLSVRGTVRDGDGAPVAGVQVSDEWNPFGAVTTNADGEYGLAGLPAGTRNFTARPPFGSPYRTASQAVTVDDGVTATADFVLSRYASVDITVTAGGAPAQASATLWLDTLFPQPVGFATADADGLLHFDVAADGDYYVQVQSQMVDYASAFFPNTVDRAAATRIQIAGEQGFAGTMALTPAAMITGVVTLPDGSPGDPYSVSARPVGMADGDSPVFPGCNLQVGDDTPGAFAIGCLHPDTDWILKAFGGGQANNEYYEDSYSVAGATAIAVDPGQTVSGIVIQLDPLSPAPTLIGMSQTYFLAGTTTPGVRVYGSNFPLEPGALTLSSSQWFGAVNAHLTVTSVVNSREAVATVTIDAGEVGPVPVTRGLVLQLVTGGVAECDCQIHIGDASTEVGSISGRVRDENGRAVAYAHVVVRTPDPGMMDGHALRTFIAGADGRWRADGLVPGSYQVEFRGTPTLAGRWWKNQSRASRAQTITLAAGSNLTSVNASLPRRAAISVTSATPRIQDPEVSFVLNGRGLSPIAGNFRVSVDVGGSLAPLTATSLSDTSLQVTGQLWQAGTFDVVVEWTAADGTVRSTRCAACITVYPPLQLYADEVFVERGFSTTLTLYGTGLVDLTGVSVDGTGVTGVLGTDIWGDPAIILTASSTTATGSRIATLTRADGATAHFVVTVY